MGTLMLDLTRSKGPSSKL